MRKFATVFGISVVCMATPLNSEAGLPMKFVQEVFKDVAKAVIVEVAKESVKGGLKSSSSPQVTSASDDDKTRTLNIIKALTDTTTPLSERIGLYATKVDYYNSGIVDHKFIFSDRKYFETRWPIRQYTIRSIDEIAVAADKSYVVARYTLDFYVAREGDSKRGYTNMAIVIGSYNSQPRVHVMKEWVHHAM